MQMCECRDPGCTVCKGTCPQPAVWQMYRCDMDDQTGTAMCDQCAIDPVVSGLYASEPIPQPEPGKEKSPHQERTIMIIKAEGFDDVMAEHHGHTAFQNAIGYLAEWNMWANRFDHVGITCRLGRKGDQPEIGALYTKTEYRITDGGAKTAYVTDKYFICAIFQPQTDSHTARFSFHS